MRIFTLGYQGLDLGSYIRELVKVGAGTVLDVRERAWSNRPDFVKSSLDEGLTRANISYIHLQAAGNPSEIRKTAKTAEECLTRYRRYLGDNPDAVGELYSHVRMAAESGRPACLLCYERNPHECHRSVLIDLLIQLDNLIQPIHLPFRSSTELRPFESAPRRRQTLLQSAFIHPLLFTR